MQECTKICKSLQELLNKDWIAGGLGGLLSTNSMKFVLCATWMHDGIDFGICISGDSENLERFCGPWVGPVRKVWIYLGMVRSWHLGRQGNAGVGVDCMGVGFGISKTLSHLGRKKVIWKVMKKFAPRKGITRIVHDCTSWAPQTVEHFVFVKDNKHNLTVVRHCNKNDKMGSQSNVILPQAPPATQYTVPRWYCWWKNSYILTYLPYWRRISSINSQYVWFLMERFADLSCRNWRLEVRKEQEWLSLGITHILKFQRLK